MNIERKFLKFIRDIAGTSKFTDLDFSAAMRVPIKEAKNFLMSLDGTYLSISYTDNSATANYQMNSMVKYQEHYKDFFDWCLTNIKSIFLSIVVVLFLSFGGFSLYKELTVWEPTRAAAAAEAAKEAKIERDKQQEEKIKKDKLYAIQKIEAEKLAKKEAQAKIDMLNDAVANGRLEIITKTNKCLDPQFSQLMLGYYDNYVVVKKDDKGNVSYRYPLNITSTSVSTSMPASNPSN